MCSEDSACVHDLRQKVSWNSKLSGAYFPVIHSDDAWCGV